MHYSHGLDGIPKTYLQVGLPNLNEEKEDNLSNDPTLLENLTTYSDEQLSEGDITQPDSPMLGDHHHINNKKMREDNNDEGGNKKQRDDQPGDKRVQQNQGHDVSRTGDY